MVKYLSRKQEQRGTRRVFLWGIVVAALICVGITVGPMVASIGSNGPAGTTGQAADQPEGISVAGKNTAPPPQAGTDANPTSIGRANAITGSATSDVHLKPAQMKAVDQYAAQHRQQVAQADFPITVGGAVPKQAGLHDIPADLALQLSSYAGDQYLLLPKQFVIVEKQTRRIVAILPVSAG